MAPIELHDDGMPSSEHYLEITHIDVCYLITGLYAYGRLSIRIILKSMFESIFSK